jgi:hypothetical protein
MNLNDKPYEHLLSRIRELETQNTALQKQLQLCNVDWSNAEAENAALREKYKLCYAGLEAVAASRKCTNPNIPSNSDYAMYILQRIDAIGAARKV